MHTTPHFCITCSRGSWIQLDVSTLVHGWFDQRIHWFSLVTYGIRYSRECYELGFLFLLLWFIGHHEWRISWKRRYCYSWLFGQSQLWMLTFWPNLSNLHSRARYNYCIDVHHGKKGFGSHSWHNWFLVNCWLLVKTIDQVFKIFFFIFKYGCAISLLVKKLHSSGFIQIQKKSWIQIVKWREIICITWKNKLQSIYKSKYKNPSTSYKAIAKLQRNYIFWYSLLLFNYWLFGQIVDQALTRVWPNPILILDLFPSYLQTSSCHQAIASLSCPSCDQNLIMVWCFQDKPCSF